MSRMQALKADELLEVIREFRMITRCGYTGGVYYQGAYPPQQMFRTTYRAVAALHRRNAIEIKTSRERLANGDYSHTIRSK
jgi:hypothetical protein